MEAPNIPKIVIPNRPFNAARFYYTGAAVFLFILMFWGFHHFYTLGQAYPGRPLKPPIRSLVIAHGIFIMLWMILFIVQPLLIAKDNRKLHMKLGILGTGIAAGAVFFGIQLAMGAARENPRDFELWGLGPRQFMAVSLSSILFFAFFVIAGILNRKKPNIHRPMMLLATLSAIPAALDRIGPIHNLYDQTIWGRLFGPFFSSLVIGLLLLCIHRLLTRSLNRWFARGYVLLVVSSFLIFQLASTAIWGRIAIIMVP